MVKDISPQDVYRALADVEPARLVDVRTEAEWVYVGLPALSALGKQVALVSWQFFPSGAINQEFIANLAAAGLTPEHEIYFICRSGARSQSAAQAAKEAGYGRVFNVADGFEGPPDADGHRGRVAGWKADGLPWQQR